MFILLFLGLNSAVMSLKTLKIPSLLPKLIVFDLDMCLWSPEMYELNEIPISAEKNGVKGKLNDDGSMEGIVAVKSGTELIKLFPASLQILQAYYYGLLGNDIRIAAASSADTPHAVKIGKAALNILEVVPGVTVRSVFNKGWPDDFEGNMQIGRTPPLSSNKADTHFPILKRETGIDYNKMVFFDDCNWGDHCATVAAKCKGVTTQKTPRGLKMEEINLALEAYEKKEIEKKMKTEL